MTSPAQDYHDNDRNYKLLLDEKFRNIHDSLELQFQTVNKTLTRIETQTLATNGKVLQLQEKVKQLEIADKTHGINCPRVKDFENMNKQINHVEGSIKDLKEDIDDRLKDVSFWVRNPKLALATIVVATCLTLFGYFEVKNYIEKHALAKIEITK